MAGAVAEAGVIIGLASVLVIGVVAQWLAWRVHLPSILLLLLAGFAAGPLTGFLDPDALLGDLLLPIVSLAVAVVLFEGGLTLKFKDIKGHGRVVSRLVTSGAVVTWVLTTVFAHFLVGLTWPIALLFGAIFVVTGPTVIGPLLRHVKPSGQSGSIVKWEGILIDPVGALLAVIVFEALFATTIEAATAGVALRLAVSLAVGTAFGAAGAGAVYALIRWRWVPPRLESAVTLGIVIAAFVGSDVIAAESGLLTVTVMGIALANQHRVHVHRILEFKENLRVLLIASLFVLLAARLELSELTALGAGAVLMLLALIFVVRPASVAVAARGSTLTWQERVFVAWMAPRGIVAAAVASLFALRLAENGHPQADVLVPLAFLLIVGTVAVYGLTAAPLARALGIADPTGRGALIVGAHPFGRAFAKALAAEGVAVLVVDTNVRSVRAARKAGLQAYAGNVLSASSQEQMDMEGLGSLIALTGNAEVNSLTAVHYRDAFGDDHVYQVATDSADQETFSDRLTGRTLFTADATLAKLDTLMRRGNVVRVERVAGPDDAARFKDVDGEPAILLAVVDRSGGFTPSVAGRKTPIKADADVIILGAPAESTD